MPGPLPQAEKGGEMDANNGSPEGFWRSVHWRWARDGKQSGGAGKRAEQQVNSARADFSVSSSAPNSRALIMKTFLQHMTL